ncbi:MAG: hypothetical protein WAO58_09745 [Fimbriimonadaceae bacterium]
MKSPEFKPVFDAALVIVRVVVLESPDKKNLENPGGDKFMEALGGKDAGLPFHAILDAKGKLIMNSKRKTPEKPEGSNIGHPFAPEEVDHFMAMLKKGAPKIKPEDSKKLELFLRNQKK